MRVREPSPTRKPDTRARHIRTHSHTSILLSNMLVTQRDVYEAIKEAMADATQHAAGGAESLAMPSHEDGWHLASVSQGHATLARSVLGFQFKMSFDVDVVKGLIAVSCVKLVIRDGCHLILYPTPEPSNAAVRMFGLTTLAVDLEKAIMPVDLTHAELDASLAFMAIITHVANGAIAFPCMFVSAHAHPTMSL